MSMKNSSDTIRNRTRNLPACSAVPQPNAPPRAPIKCIGNIILYDSGKDFITFLASWIFQQSCVLELIIIIIIIINKKGI